MFNLKKVKSLEKENVDLKSHNDLLIQRIEWYQTSEKRLIEIIKLLESQLQAGIQKVVTLKSINSMIEQEIIYRNFAKQYNYDYVED